MKAVFVHLSGSHRGKTEVFTSHEISVGTDASNDLCFDPTLDENTSKHHAEILLSNCEYVLKDK